MIDFSLRFLDNSSLFIKRLFGIKTSIDIEYQSINHRNGVLSKICHLDELNLSPRYHFSALVWIWIFWEMPGYFNDKIKMKSLDKRMDLVNILLLHSLPYMFIVSVIGDVILAKISGLFETPVAIVSLPFLYIFFFYILRFVIGLIIGYICMYFFGPTVGLAFGCAFGFTFRQIVGLTLLYILGFILLRIFQCILHFLFLWPIIQPNRYLYHPVTWDAFCSIPFLGLDRILVAYAELEPEAGEWEIERIISNYPSQRMMALRAKAVLIARKAGRESDLTRLESIAAQLPEGDKGFLKQTSRVCEMVNEICRIQRRLDGMTRPIFQEPLAMSLYKEIENFSHRMAGFCQPLAREFRAAAEQWLKIAQQRWNDARMVVEKEPAPQIFRAGDPVDREREAFVVRNAAIGELESQLMTGAGCPGLILYGRRRMGKSTLLRNLEGFLPTPATIVYEEMMNAKAFTSLDQFVKLLTRRIHESFSGIENSRQVTNLMEFQDFLAQCNQLLKEREERLFFVLDEYEYIDRKIGEGVFPEDLLFTFRESIQNHRRLTWIFCGSHQIDELKNASWTSYLISARTVEVLPFEESETRTLLTEPLKHSTFWKDADEKRPRFDPGFWGEGGIERIHAEAGGWPHLVQLIAGTVVDLINDDSAKQVTPELMEKSLNRAIVRGDSTLRELLEKECQHPGEWEYLCGFRRNDAQPIPGDESIYRSLRRRTLVCEENGQWRLRVPIMQRWLRERG